MWFGEYPPPRQLRKHNEAVFDTVTLSWHDKDLSRVPVFPQVSLHHVIPSNSGNTHAAVLPFQTPLHRKKITSFFFFFLSFMPFNSPDIHIHCFKISSAAIQLAGQLEVCKPVGLRYLTAPLFPLHRLLNVICVAVLAHFPAPPSMRGAYVPQRQWKASGTIASCVPFPVICPSLLFYWGGLLYFLIITPKQWFQLKMGSPPYPPAILKSLKPCFNLSYEDRTMKLLCCSGG